MSAETGRSGRSGRAPGAFHFLQSTLAQAWVTFREFVKAKLGEFEENANLGTLVLTAAIEEDIQPFVAEELAIAAADLACRAELGRVREELQREYEGLFIDEHRDQLKEIRGLEQQLMDLLLEGWQW